MPFAPDLQFFGGLVATTMIVMMVVMKRKSNLAPRSRPLDRLCDVDVHVDGDVDVHVDDDDDAYDAA